MQHQLVLPRSWKSELHLTILFLLSSLLTLLLSRTFPGTIITGEILPTSNGSLLLSLPLFWFVPFGFLVTILYRIYNVRYVIDGQGLETRDGVLNFQQRIVRVRYEDIRSVESKQNVLQRLLNIGDIEVGTAAVAGVEIVFHGVGAPHEIREWIKAERDRRQKVLVQELAGWQKSQG